jgi:hypothetical protein
MEGERARRATARPARLVDLLDYAPGAVVSRVLAKASGGSVTLFAFEAGQELSEHAAPFDALVDVFDGEVELTIGGKPVMARSGETVLKAAGIHPVEQVLLDRARRGRHDLHPGGIAPQHSGRTTYARGRWRLPIVHSKPAGEHPCGAFGRRRNLALSQDVS